MADTRQARRLFDLGVLSLGIAIDGQEAVRNPGQALRAFARASEWDPTMGDAWIGRVHCGDVQPAVLFHLFRTRHSIGVEQRRVGLTPGTLNGRFATGLYLDFPLRSSIDAVAAYAASLIEGGDPDGAEEVLRSLGPAENTAICDYIHATMHFKTQRWPDVLLLLGQSHTWSDEFLRAAADMMAGSACAQLGLFTEAIRRLEAAEKGPIPAAATAALFTHGLTLREEGHEEAAKALFEQVYSRDPAFEANSQALRDPRYRLVLTTPEVIASRRNKWDPTSVPDDSAVSPERPESGDELLSEAMRELDHQVGLISVKTQVKKLQSTVAMAKVRAERGLTSNARSLHLAFTGPPGTGKTTIARIIAKTYCGMGLLKSDTIIEVSRRDLVGEHLGSTAPKTSAVIDRAIDGVLFIDEAYTLIQTGLSGGDAFGREAVDTLLARMENDRDRLVVIIAGYDGEIDRLLATNDGLASRFSRRIRFDSYTPRELSQIGEVIARARDSVLPAESVQILEEACAPLYAGTSVDQLGQPRRLIDLAGNGRFIRNIIEMAEEEREFRLSSGDFDIDKLDADALMRIEPVDMRASLEIVLGAMKLGR